MRKADLAEKVAFITGTDKAKVVQVLESAMAHIKETLAQGDEVTLRGFGTFAPKHRAEKLGRNIKKGEPVHIPAHDIPHFKPAKEFREKLRRPDGGTIQEPTF